MLQTGPGGGWRRGPQPNTLRPGGRPVSPLVPSGLCRVILEESWASGPGVGTAVTPTSREAAGPSSVLPSARCPPAAETRVLGGFVLGVWVPAPWAASQLPAAAHRALCPGTRDSGGGWGAAVRGHCSPGASVSPSAQWGRGGGGARPPGGAGPGAGRGPGPPRRGLGRQRRRRVRAPDPAATQRRRPPTRRHGPCGALRRFCWCAFWCWQRVARSTPTGQAAECVQSGLTGAPFLSPLCSACTSLSSPPVTGTGPAAPTEPSIGPPTDAALGWPPPGLDTHAALAGRGPAGSSGPAEQQYANRRAGTEGAASSLATAAAQRGGRVTPASQMWTNAVLAGAAVPSAASTLPAVTGASVGRGTACLQMAHSVCPTEGPPGWPPTRQKLQLVLAPLHSLASQALELGLPDPGSLLVHSLQQLGRIDSLSEQISFLEEQLGSCSCKKDS
ncbi:epidermal growth factor-like protein 7 isoform X1 [Saimiri boliviensis]|uniref:epidermal growth factor-like protein 7 isoform X1 n=1 Tax=Saimiri boliviensis TaxID=27679 RepID=UPI003D78764C